MSSPFKCKNILITGSKGFIAKNLITKLSELNYENIFEFSKENSTEDLAEYVKKSDIIFHLAGENRPKNPEDFEKNNTSLTNKLCEIIEKHDKKIPIIFTSSTQAVQNNSYGISKLKAEKRLIEMDKRSSSDVFIFRLPGIFGKWCKPNYNSVVATFCHNAIYDLEIRVDDKNKELLLCYIDDLIDDLVKLLDSRPKDKNYLNVTTTYLIKLEDLHKKIINFKNIRKTNIVGSVGEGIDRALYSTFISYLPKDDFSYKLTSNIDERGNFVEMLKTQSSGQFSFFTSHPGITRGEHYHHTKTEKFLVLQGQARFRFKNILSGETHEIISEGDKPMIIESIPGWSHDIKNIGSDIMIVMLWANEIYDKGKPDTYMAKTF